MLSFSEFIPTEMACVLSPIHTNKTCLIKHASLLKWKLVTESWTIGFDIGCKQALTYAFIFAKSVVDKKS